MGDFLIPLEIGVAVLVLAVLAVVALAVRRRWLSRSVATFECSARIDAPLPEAGRSDHPTPSARWALGVARYNGEHLEWFRYFSYALSPRFRWLRNEITVVETRGPDAVEALSLYATHRIVRIHAHASTYEVAMDAGSITGFMAWLEAAPPGSHASPR